MKIQPKTLIIILILLIIVLAALNLFKKPYQPLQVISVSPLNSAEDVDLDVPLEIRFNREPTTFSVLSQPEIDYSPQTSDTTLTLVLNQPLKPKTQYSLTVLSQGKTISSWSFTTRLFTEGEAIEEEIKITQETYPLIDFVPYETENFRIAYEEPLYLRVKIKKKNVSTIKKEVLDWIRSKEVDPQTHQIEWLTPGP